MARPTPPQPGEKQAAAVEVAPDLVLDGRLALYHRSEKWLAVADLHFGYEVTRRHQGGLFPLWGMTTIGERLHQLVATYRPGSLVLCGDIIDGEGPVDEVVSLVAEVAKAVPGPVVCIAGNHDRGLVRRRLAFHDEWETPGFRFHHGHEPARFRPRGDGKTCVVGHLHPTAKFNDGAGLSLKLPTLVKTQAPQGGPLWVLPAFSPWSSGRDWRKYGFGSGTDVWACSPERVFRLPRAGAG